jgi:hypothetical protein
MESNFYVKNKETESCMNQIYTEFVSNVTSVSTDATYMPWPLYPFLRGRKSTVRVAVSIKSVAWEGGYLVSIIWSAEIAFACTLWVEILLKPCDFVACHPLVSLQLPSSLWFLNKFLPLGEGGRGTTLRSHFDISFNQEMKGDEVGNSPEARR